MSALALSSNVNKGDHGFFTCYMKFWVLLPLKHTKILQKSNIHVWNVFDLLWIIMTQKVWTPQMMMMMMMMMMMVSLCRRTVMVTATSRAFRFYSHLKTSSLQSCCLMKRRSTSTGSTFNVHMQMQIHTHTHTHTHTNLLLSHSDTKQPNQRFQPIKSFVQFFHRKGKVTLKVLDWATDWLTDWMN